MSNLGKDVAMVCRYQLFIVLLYSSMTHTGFMYEPVCKWWSGLPCETRSVVCAATTCAAWQTCNWGWSRWYTRTKKQSYVKTNELSDLVSRVEQLESQKTYVIPLVNHEELINGTTRYYNILCEKRLLSLEQLVERNTNSLMDLYKSQDDFVSILAHGLDEGETLESLLCAVQEGHSVFLHMIFLSDRLYRIEHKLGYHSTSKSRKRRTDQRCSSLPSHHRQLKRGLIRNLSLPIKPVEQSVKN